MSSSVRRILSISFLVLIGIALLIFSETTAAGFFELITDESGKLNLVTSMIFLSLLLPGLFLTIGHAKRAVHPVEKRDRTFWICSLVYNVILITPPVLIILSDLKLIVGQFDQLMLFTAAFPLVGIVLSSAVLAKS